MTMTELYLTEKRLKLPEDLVHAKVLLPWVSRAERALWEAEPPYPVTETARLHISLILFNRLLKLAKCTLDTLLADLLRMRNPVLQWNLKLATKSERAQCAAELLRKLQAEKLQPVFERAPLLSDYLDGDVQRFIAMIRELLTAVSADRAAICSLLTGGDFGAVTNLRCELADLHFHGRCTMVVETEKSCFLYKPHDCRADALFHEIVERWFSDITVAPRCVVRPGYAFCEYINSVPAKTQKDAECYYWNLGGLCALFQALGSTDLHSENFLASGVRPVLVDFETVLTPVPRVFNDPSIYPDLETEEESFISDLNCSLFGSSLLPKQIGKQQYSILLSTEEDNCTQPVLNGEKQTVRGFEALFFDGFSEIYDRCIALRQELIKMLDRFKDIPVRKLLRQTNYYAGLQKRLLSPKTLESRETQRRAFEELSDYFITHGAAQLVSIAEWEKTCLFEGDIPYFSALGGGIDLLGYGQVIAPGFFKESAVENAKKRLKRMNKAEKAFEIAILKRSLSSALEPASAAEFPRDKKDFSHVPPIQDAQAVDEAERLFRKICAEAVVSPCGKISWLTQIGDLDCFSAVKPCLFQGSAGMGVFFAATAAVSSRSDVVKQAKSFSKICLEQIKEVYTQLEPAEKIPEGLMPLGLSSGLGGVLRSLVLMGRYLNDRSAILEAKKFLDLLSEDQILSAQQVDVISGTAGLLTVLCGYEELRETKAGKQAACWCVKQLLQHKNQQDKDGASLWDPLKLGRPVSGFGHGMAGIGTALLQASVFLDDGECRKASLDALHFEHRIYSEKLGTWPDLRDTAQSSRAMHGFCSGAPGIGLALLETGRLLGESDMVMQDLERALEICVKQPLLSRDHLCCGNSAAVDFLIEYAVRTGSVTHKEQARRILSQMSARSLAAGDYVYLPSSYRPVFSPTLFYGGAGVGYELLRLAYPERIHSVLI